MQNEDDPESQPHTSTVHGNQNFVDTNINAGGNVSITLGFDSEEDATIKWLSHLKSKTIQKDAFEARQGNTGEWLLKNDDYQRWLSDDAASISLLWCKGHAGVGKTTLLSLVIETLRLSNTPDTLVCCVFFVREQHKDVKLGHVFCELLSQILIADRNLFAKVPESWKFFREAETLPPLGDIRSVLKTMISRWKTVFFVCDALDECPDRIERSFLNEIFSVLRVVPESRLLVSSRDLDDLAEGTPLEPAPVLWLRAQDEDLRLYIEKQVQDRPGLHVPRRNARLRKDMSDLLVDLANGMFLFVTLSVELIADIRPGNVAEFKRVLRNLPVRSLSKLDEMYEAIWQRILMDSSRNNHNRSDLSVPAITTARIVNPDKEEHKLQNLGKHTLFFLVFGALPLNIEQLKHALAIQPSRKASVEQDDLYDQTTIVGSCLSLVSVDSKGWVRYTHNTAQVYFESRLADMAVEAHTMIASKCLAYLRLKTVGPCLTVEQILTDFDSFPFLEYVSQHWPSHFKSAEVALLLDQVTELLEHPNQAARALRIHASQGLLVPTELPRLPRYASGYHLAAYLGLLQKVWLPSWQLINLDIEDENGWTPLQWAVSANNVSSVSHFIMAGCDVDHQNNVGETALMWAISSLHDAAGPIEPSYIIRNKAVVVGTVHEARHTRPGRRVAARCSAVIIETLIKFTRLPNLCDTLGRTLVHRAARNHQFAIVEKILELGATVDIVDKLGCTALMEALRPMHTSLNIDHIRYSGNCFVVMGDYTFDFGVEQSEHTRDMYHDTSIMDHESILTRLIGSSAVWRSPQKDMSLCLAASLAYPRLVSKLLSAGADINYCFLGAYTPLMFACMPAIGDECLWDIGHSIVEDNTVTFLNSIMDHGHMWRFDGWSDEVGPQQDYDWSHSSVDLEHPSQPCPQSLPTYHDQRILTCRILLKEGAEPLKRLSNGWTAIDLAQTNGFVEMYTMIEEHVQSAASEMDQRGEFSDTEEDSIQNQPSPEDLLIRPPVVFCYGKNGDLIDHRRTCGRWPVAFSGKRVYGKMSGGMYPSAAMYII